MEPKTLWTYIVGGLLAACAIWFTMSLFSGPGWKLERISQVESILDQYRSLIQSDATKEDWSEFQDQTVERLTEMAGEIEDQVGDGDHTTIDLLRLSRDFLPQLVRSGTARKPKLEEQCSSLISRIKQQQEASQQWKANELGSLEKLILLVNGLFILLIGRLYFG